MSRWREKAAWPWHYASLAARSLLAGSARPEPVRPQPVRRLLVLGYAAVGDFVFLLPALRALRSGLPRARVTFAANRSPISEELLPACGLADEIWTCESEELSRGRGRRRFERRIAAAGFDAVVASQATPMRGFARAVLGVPIRIGHCRALEAAREGWSPARYALWRLRFGLISEEFDRRWAFNRPVWARPESEHAVVRNLRLARALGVSTAGFEGPPPLPDGQRERQAARALLEAAPAGALV
ncbi:MAG: hypothetical protein KGK30_05165, partial [Elusimicrobia bacterium]|nr:hypothetical protein [Elusimicrobiota bacterium]